MAWIYLLLAGLTEIGWAVGLKYTEGFSKPIPSVLTVLSMMLSLGLLGFALRSLPLGSAYAIWTGIGTVGTVIFGIAFLGESFSVAKIACVALIVAGIVGLKLVTTS